MDSENTGIPATMLVGPTGYGMNNGGFGNGFGGDWAWILLLLVLFGGGWNNGFGGGFGGDLYPWMNNSQNINGGFRDQMIFDNISGIRDGIVGIGTQLSNAQMANLERSFAAQTANTAGLNALQAQLAQCCCDNRQATSDLRYTVGTEACATRTANAENTNALLAAFNCGIQSIKDQLCQDKIDAKNDTIAQLRSELMYARGQASQDVQTAAIQAGQRTLANEVEQYVAPRAVPAYVVQNPNCCGQNYGCGFGG